MSGPNMTPFFSEKRPIYLWIFSGVFFDRLVHNGFFGFSPVHRGLWSNDRFRIGKAKTDENSGQKNHFFNIKKVEISPAAIGYVGCAAAYLVFWPSRVIERPINP